MTEPHEHDAEPTLPSSTKTWLVYGGIGLAGLAVFGFVTWMLGLGPFAYRNFLYGGSEIYVLNMTDKSVFVTLDRGSPIEVGPEGAERTPILGGTTHIVTKDADGKIIDEFDVDVDGSPTLYNVAGHRCMVLADVSSYYLDPSNGQVVVAKTFAKGEHRAISIPGEHVIWPRQTLRDQVGNANAGVYWVDLVACPLLEKDEEHLLQGSLNVILTERKHEQKRRQKELEIRRKMMREGSEAVDKMVGVTPDVGATDSKPVTETPAKAVDAGDQDAETRP